MISSESRCTLFRIMRWFPDHALAGLAAFAAANQARFEDTVSDHFGC
jgi:hypothetical protein